MLSVIMAGGVGERFWPCSRRNTPKQLLDLTGRGSMIALTLDRVRGVSRPEETFVITTASQHAAVAAEIEGRVDPGNIVAEPQGRNTAASIGLAAVLVRHRFGDEPFMVLPADHLVGDMDRYEELTRAAEEYARHNDCLLTFGITPSRPETGYGYIQVGRKIQETGGVELFEARSFHEKPTPGRARKFVEEGVYFWNSGMFFWKPGAILGAIEKHLRELHSVLAALEERVGTDAFESVFNSMYPRVPSISVDYGIMEKAKNVVVLKSDFYWNDVGSWESIREVYTPDDVGNVLVGDHVVIDGKENTVFSPNRTVGVVGLDGLVVVDGGDAILVCKRERAQQVREVVEILKKASREELL